MNQAPPDGGRSELSRVLEALAREYDRCILYYLIENEPATFDEVVDEVVEWETGEPAAHVSDDTYQDIKATLRHTWLPKLEDLGIIEYDERSGAIRYRNPPSDLEEFLRLARDLEEN